MQTSLDMTELHSLRGGLNHFIEGVFSILGDVWHLAVLSEEPELWSLDKVLCFLKGLFKKKKNNSWDSGKKLSSASGSWCSGCTWLIFFHCFGVFNTLIHLLMIWIRSLEKARWVKAAVGQMSAIMLGQQSVERKIVSFSLENVCVCCLYIKNKTTSS